VGPSEQRLKVAGAQGQYDFGAEEESMSIERLPWWKTTHPNRQIFRSDRAYVTAWLSLLVARWKTPEEL
jgi:hypothetical protein